MSTHTMTIHAPRAYTAPTSTQSTVASTAYIQRPLGIADVRGLVDALVAEMQAIPVFSVNAAGILQWQSAMNSHDLTMPVGLQRASTALGFLIRRVIRPTLVANRSNLALAMRIGPLEGQTMQILEITCPDAEARKTLMDSYLTLAKKGATKKEQKQKVIDAYAGLEARLNQMTELNRETLRAIFEDLKAQLLALNESQEQAAEAIKQQLTKLSQSMADLSEQFSAHAESAVHVAEDLMAYKTGLSRTLREMQAVAQRASS